MSATATNPPTATGESAAWAVIAGLAALAGLCLAWRPVAIDPASATSLIVACASLGGAAWFYRAVRPRENFAVMCVALAQMLLFSAVGIVLSYLLARGGGPLWDARLAAWDRAIGFDWLAYVRAIDSSAALTGAFRIAYASLIPQIIVLVLALGFAGRLAQLRTVMLGAILCGAVTILLSPLFPAVSNFVHLGLTASDFRHVDPFAGYIHLADLNALRDGSYTELNLTKMQGIITFPSYHAGLSAVTLWGFWSTRQAWIRWPGMALAAATIAATPVDGGHYLVDVIAGCAIAAAAVWMARRMIRWNPAWPRLTASPSRRSRAASAR